MIFNQEADELAYRCAFACESKCYKVIEKGKVTDYQDEFTKTQLADQLKKDGKIEGKHYKFKRYRVVDDEQFVIHTIDTFIDRIKNAVFYMRDGGVIECTKLRLWLTPNDKSNFRFKVAVTPGPKGIGYKNGRGEKPYYLQFIRDYMVEEHGAKYTYGYEADDALGIFQTKNSVASHIDKDIDMIPGWHYHHLDRMFYYCPQGLGTLELKRKKNKSPKLKGKSVKFFYAQMLMGDTVDNIPGIKGFGPVATYELLDRHKTEYECYKEIEKQYRIYYGKDWKNVLLEVADLLWICRKKGQTGRQYLTKFLED